MALDETQARMTPECGLNHTVVFFVINATSAVGQGAAWAQDGQYLIDKAALLNCHGREVPLWIESPTHIDPTPNDAAIGAWNVQENAVKK